MRLPRALGGGDLIRRLRTLGYEPTRHSGSHVRLTRTSAEGGHHVTIPLHSPLRVGTLMVFMGTGPFGALAAGALADTLGAPLTVRLGGLVCVAGAAVFALRLPALRKDARRLIVALEAVGGEPSDEANGGAGAAVPRVA